MSYIIGALVGASLLIAGFFMGRLSMPKTESHEPESELPKIAQKLIEEQEERNRQWDNLMNYTGKSQVARDED